MRYILLSVALAITLGAQAQLAKIPANLSEAEIESHQSALLLLNSIYDQRHLLSAADERPGGRSKSVSADFLREDNSADIAWLKDKGYIETSVYEEAITGELYPLLHLNPRIVWRGEETVNQQVDAQGYIQAEPKAYTVTEALSKSGYHLRRAWTLQGGAICVGFIGGIASLIMYRVDTRLAADITLGATGVVFTAFQIGVVSHQVRRAKILEAIPGGARFRF